MKATSSSTYDLLIRGSIPFPFPLIQHNRSSLNCLLFQRDYFGTWHSNFLFLSLIDILLCLDQRLSSHANPKVQLPALTYTHTTSGSTCRQNHAIVRGVSPNRMDTAKVAVANVQNIFTDNVYVMWGGLGKPFTWWLSTIYNSENYCFPELKYVSC